MEYFAHVHTQTQSERKSNFALIQEVPLKVPVGFLKTELPLLRGWRKMESWRLDDGHGSTRETKCTHLLSRECKMQVSCQNSSPIFVSVLKRASHRWPLPIVLQAAVGGLPFLLLNSNADSSTYLQYDLEQLISS